MKKVHIKLLLLFVIVSGTLYSQESNNESTQKGEKFTVNVKEEIGEHDIFLLKKELKASEYVIEYIYINHINRTVEFIGEERNLNKYIEILSSYFKKYEIIYKGKIIYSSEKTKKITTHEK